jgi:mRNA interferase MazF
MTTCSPGDVVLVRFPFTSLRAAKKRPAVVVSRTEFSARHGDVIVVALTSVDQGAGHLALDDWEDAGLVKPTWIKPLVATLESGLIETRAGALSSRDCRKVGGALRAAIAAEFIGP